MLEAFQKVGDPLQPEKEVVSKRSPSTAPEARTPLAPSNLSHDPFVRLRSFPAVPGWLPWLALIGVAFVIGIVVGRRGNGVEAAATEPTADVGPSDSPARKEPASQAALESPPAPAPGATGGPESALYDPKNQYTVVVATYPQTAEDYAWATYDHLREQRVAVFAPLGVGDKIVVLVGAAPRSSDLAALEEKIEGLSRDGNPRAYGDAYRERIDDLIRR